MKHLILLTLLFTSLVHANSPIEDFLSLELGISFVKLKDKNPNIEAVSLAPEPDFSSEVEVLKKEFICMEVVNENTNSMYTFTNGKLSSMSLNILNVDIDYLTELVTRFRQPLKMIPATSKNHAVLIWKLSNSYVFLTLPIVFASGTQFGTSLFPFFLIPTCL